MVSCTVVQPGEEITITYFGGEEEPSPHAVGLTNAEWKRCADEARNNAPKSQRCYCDFPLRHNPVTRRLLLTYTSDSTQAERNTAVVACLACPTRKCSGTSTKSQSLSVELWRCAFV